MGNSESFLGGKKQKRRRPSVHSGNLYIPQDLKSRHIKFNSGDFDKSASDLKENLPEDLKVYCDSIEVMYRFWCSEIETLNDNALRETAVLFYMNIFKLIPEARNLFTKNIELQAKQFFGMFRWLITNLKQPNAERLIARIKMLGKMHKKMNIKEEWYQYFLEAFHETMSEITNTKYTSRNRFCMEQLYTVVMNIMLDKDFESLSSAKIAHLLKSLGKLEDCLEDKEGRTYLQMYMRQQFCVELMLFYQDYRKFKECLSSLKRQQMGTDIVRNYIGDSAQCEINVSYVAKNNVLMTLKINDDIFIPSIFDKCVKETVELIRNNVWIGFKKSILKMAVDADVNYEKDKESSLTLHASSPKLQFSSFSSSSTHSSC